VVFSSGKSFPAQRGENGSDAIVINNSLNDTWFYLLSWQSKIENQKLTALFKVKRKLLFKSH